jgi:hypothetical protein
MNRFLKSAVAAASHMGQLLQSACRAMSAAIQEQTVARLSLALRAVRH